MDTSELLRTHLYDTCPNIHLARLEAVMDVAAGLQKSKSLSLSAMGRGLSSNIDDKHKIKKVDRLEGNKHLHGELDTLYGSLSDYIFKYVAHDVNVPILIDLCFIKDNKDIQMLSAEVALKGRSLPIYRDIFGNKNLKGRAGDFLAGLSECLPENKEVVIVMDAGFGGDWFKEIEKYGWYWVLRVRQGKAIKLEKSGEWIDVNDFFPKVSTRAKSYDNAVITKKHNHSCRIITKRNTDKNTKSKYARQPRNYNAGNGDYKRSAKEPWVLATNLPLSYNSTKVVKYYEKRMQIEESFRDLKSPQFGLSARYARTKCIHRWGVKMLLGAIVQVIFWILGVIGHSQDLQRRFQANTVRDKKVFSYFYLGQMIIEYDKLHLLKIDYDDLLPTIQKELSRNW
jgi:hypothetical protein